VVACRALGTAHALLLLLHGGPGAGHDYLEPLSALADERPVIFYDQLGCGRSDRPDDASMWHIEHFVEEIDVLRQALRLHHVVLYGHSWGGWLAQEYLARRGGATHVDALIPPSTSACIYNRFLSTVKS
jgi:proline-specific peptidase